MSKVKGFNTAWYHSRLIFGFILVLLSIITLLFSNTSSRLLLILGIGSGVLIGAILAWYYNNNPKLQKELSIRQKIFSILGFLVIIFLNRSIFVGSELSNILQLIIFITSFFGSMVGIWGLLGKSKA